MNHKQFLGALSVLAISLPLAGSWASAGTQAAHRPKGFVIGFANGYIGNSWRTQMVADVEQVAKPYEKMGLVKRVIVENTNNDLATQISQIQDMINSGVNAIVVDAVSPAAVVPVLNRARAKGILVIGTDNGIIAPKALNVVFDQGKWAAISAAWVLRKMGYKGNLLAVNGLAGQAANTIRWNAVKALLKKHPAVHLLQQVYGSWDEAAAKQAVSSVLSSYPSIQGVWTQDGMAIGAIQAFQAASRKLPVVATDDNLAFLRMWNTMRAKGLHSIGVFNPPGIAADAFLVTVRLLLGWKLKSAELHPNPIAPTEKNTVLVEPTLVVTNHNLTAVLKRYRGRPGSYYLDGWLTVKQVDSLFQGH